MNKFGLDHPLVVMQSEIISLAQEMGLDMDAELLDRIVNFGTKFCALVVQRRNEIDPIEYDLSQGTYVLSIFVFRLNCLRQHLRYLGARWPRITLTSTVQVGNCFCYITFH